MTRLRPLAISLAVLSAVGAGARAEGTLGVEWEFNPQVGVIGVTVAGEPQDHLGTIATVGGLNERPDRLTVDDGQRVMCSSEGAGEKYPLVSITHDLQWQGEGEAYGSSTLEIVTGPIPYTDQARWKRVASFVTAFFKAAREECKTTPLRTQRTQDGLAVRANETIEVCYVSAQSIVDRMNTTTPGIARGNGDGGCEGGDPKKAENPKTVGIFFKKGYFTWMDIRRVSVGSTQVNVALKLTTMGRADVDLAPLFFLQHEVAASSYRHTRSDLVDRASDDLTRGFLTLYAYGVNTATEAAKRGSNYGGMMVANKNLYDLYPKSLLGDVLLASQLKASVLDGADQLCSGTEDHKQRCRDVAQAWNKEILRGKGGDPIKVAKPIGPFGQGEDTEIVVEMRRLMHPLNQAMTLQRGWFSSDLDLANYPGMKTFFDRYFAE